MLYKVEVSKTMTTELNGIVADSKEQAIEKAIKIAEEDPDWFAESIIDWEARAFLRR